METNSRHLQDPNMLKAIKVFEAMGLVGKKRGKIKVRELEVYDGKT